MSPERRGKYQVNFEQVALNAKELTLRDGHHVPILIVEGSMKYLINTFREMPDTHQARAQMMDLIGRTFATNGRIGRLRQVFFICEGWMSMGRKENLPKIRPSEDPDRLEVLIISGLQVEGNKKNLILFQMDRDNQNRLVDLREIKPSGERAGEVEVPLLDAFVKGFQGAIREQVS